MSAFAPLRLPAFRRLATTYALNELCFDFGAVALAVLVFEATGSALATTALFLATTFAPALLAPALTARVDRMPVRRALTLLHAAEALILLALALCAGAFSLPVVLALALLDGTIAIGGRALTRAGIAGTLRPLGLLSEGNRLINNAKSICFATAPAVAGVLIATVSVAASLVVAAVLFAVMAVLVATARDLPAAEADAVTSWRERLRAAVAHVRAEPAVRRVIAGHTLANVSLSAIAPIEIVYATRTLGGDSTTYGLLLAVWGAGTVVSGIALTRARRPPSPLTLVPIAAATMGAGQLVMAGAPGVAVALAGCAIAGAGNGFYFVNVVQAIQDRTRDDLQGRVAALLESVTAGAYGVGFLLGGALATLFDPRVALAASAVGALVVAGVMVRWLRPLAATPLPALEPPARVALPEAA